jgi:hypothetical protein
MTSQADAASKLFEQVIENFRKTAETTLSAQKELYQLWQSSWAGIGQPQMPWLDQLREFQQSWSNTVVDLARKHREMLDRQYKAGINALEEAFGVCESSDPEEFRKRAEKLCRNNLDCLKEISEAQIQEFQNATTKWIEFMTKGAPSEKTRAEE